MENIIKQQFLICIYALILFSVYYLFTDLSWERENSNEMAYINDLKLENNSIVIPEDGSGTYFIYSVVTQDFSAFGKIPQGFLSIYKSNPYILDRSNNSRLDIVVMNKYEGSAVTQKFKTSFVCVVYNLKGGESVTIKTSAEQNLFHNEPFANYFGILKL